MNNKKRGLSHQEYELAHYLRRIKKNTEQTFDYENLNKLREKYNEWLKEDKIAQEYLDSFYPLNERSNVQKLYFNKINLSGSLKLEGFTNLRLFRCENNQLSSLDLRDCVNLEELGCYGNRLTSVQFLSSLPNPEKLTELSLSNNNFPRQNLDIFSRFVNLEFLALGTINDEEKIKQGIYNRFHGSLEPLKNLKIREIDIQNNQLTDLDFLNGLNLEKLTSLEIGRNNFLSQDLSIFSNFRDLIKLGLGSNNFSGNLKHLREFLKELIEKKIELTRFKELEEDSPDYDEKCEKYGKECRKIKKEMKKKLGSEDMNEVRRVIKDCKKIARWQIELEKKLDSKQLLLGEKNQASQITNYYDNNHQKSEKKLVSYHDQIIQKLTDNEQNIVEPILEEKPVGRGGFAEVYRGK
ncbi:hypothetical protein C1645_745471 [Glomus cerebriforme]|uniref:Protein kinase domain-containing protein n=1 Tax=Glomus cerebriforme TaxID=658196 RepID=A0A397S2C6_9GLOM|nr:hypothetical protein C1645_745471 [Glomus cerebriforme]